MKPAPFAYAAPETLDEAAGMLAEDGDAKVLAGGQSLVPLLNFRLAAPSLLVDLRRVPGLDLIERVDGGVRIGAMVRQRRAEESAEVADACPLVRAALRHVAHPQIRSRGTVGGSIAHADPAAELPAVLVALDGRVVATGPAGPRTIAAGDLFETFFTTSLRQGEILTAVELPAAPPRSGVACLETSRRAGDYALCGVVAQVTLAEDDTVDDARLALFGVGPRPVRVLAAEERLRGAAPDTEVLDEAGRLAADATSPADDVQATASYRRHLARVLSRRALEQAVAEARA